MLGIGVLVVLLMLFGIWNYEFFRPNGTSTLKKSSAPKRLAVVYRGFYRRTLNNSYRRRVSQFDDVQLKNHVANLYAHFDEVDVYFHTYTASEPLDRALVKRFNDAGYPPKRHIFEKQVHGKITHSIIQSLGLIDRTKDYDTVVNLRFDVTMIRAFPTWDINPARFYCAWQEPRQYWRGSEPKVSDLVFVFPPKYVSALIVACKENENVDKKGTAHFIHNSLVKRIGKINLSFIVDGRFPSGEVNSRKNGLFFVRDDSRNMQ